MNTGWTSTEYIRVYIAPPKPTIPAPVLAALDLFGLKIPTTREAVKSAYKLLAKQHHPDAGGDAEMMKRVNAAYDLLMKGR